MKQQSTTKIIDATENHAGEFRWGDPNFTDQEGNEWLKMLSGLNPRCKSVEDAMSGKWAQTWEEREQCDFEAIPHRKQGTTEYAYLLMKVWPPRGMKFYTSLSSCCYPQYVPCDYTGPDPIMRDVA